MSTISSISRISRIFRRKKEMIILVLLFFVILIGGHKTMVGMGLNYAETLGDQSIQYAKEKLETYDNYRANDRTKSLVRLLDKTVEFANNLEQNKQSDPAKSDSAKSDPAKAESLNQYAREQRIKGILVLDENLNTVLQTTTDGDTFFKWKDLLQSDSVKEIIECPKKVYMTRVDRGEETCDVAVVARKDEAGVILAYVLQDTVKDGVNDITLENIFEGTMIDQDASLIISKGDRILATNKNEEQEEAVKKLEKISEKGILVRENLRRIKYNGKQWYVREANYQDYTIHLMLSVNEIYRPYYMIQLAIIILYFVLCVVIARISWYLQKKNFDELKKSYDIIEAENKVYLATLLVNLKNGESEWIKIPEKIRVKFAPYSSRADKIFERISKSYVRDTFREEYLKFTEIHTVEERLKGKNFISFTYENQSGNWISVKIVSQHTDQSGKMNSVLYLISDVTEEMKKEKEYQRQLKITGEAKTNFLRRMSHDIRTPINGIRGIIEIAEHNPDDQKLQRECFSKVKTASGYLMELVNDILDMSKLESGEVKLDHRSFCLPELLEKLNEIIQMQCRECGITYHVDKHQIVHRRLLGSPLHLQRLLMNFASNAVKYNRENGQIFVSTREVSSTEDRAEFEFICRDTGIGMSEEFQKHIFEPFTQEKVSSRTTYTGTGLGMSIAKELVELQNGTIEMESKLGEGTTFTVHLSFEIDRSEQGEEKKNEDTSFLYEIGGRHILLVEDNELNMQVAEYLLEEKGALVTKAWNGKEALELFLGSEEGYFDVILMDIMMPVMGGWETTRQIRSLDREDAKRIPIIAMSANAFQEDIEHSVKSGMNAHITKPLNMDEVIKTIVKSETVR